MQITGRSFGLTAGVLALLVMLPLQAGARDLEDAITDLYGGDGITLDNSAGHQAHFESSAQTELGQLGQSVQIALSAFTPSAPVSSFTFDLEQGVFTRSTHTLGPLVASRARTIGRLKVNVGLSYTETIYKRFEGSDLDQIFLSFTHQDDPPAGIGNPSYELDQIGVNVDLEIEQRVAALSGTLGLTPNWDVGLILPYVWNRLQADAYAFVIKGDPTTNFHSFGGASESAFSSEGGHAEGIGDLVLRTKYFVLDAPGLGEGASPLIPDVALLGQVRFPTGRDEDLLGAGEYSVLPMVILSREYWGRVEPHLNLGYEVTTGDTEDDSLQWIAGAAFGVVDSLTIPIDLIGRHELKKDGVGDNLIDLSLGLKMNVFKTVLLAGNVKFPMNGDEGLRADYIWSLGVEATFP
jgi:hypothetical protein